MKEQEARRRLNVIGVVVLGLIALAVLLTEGVGRIRRGTQVSGEQAKIDKLAQDFALRDRAVIDRWARGEYKDAWGNVVVLLSNDESGVQFLSGGPDGVSGTEDDIHSKVFASKPRRFDAIQAEQEPMPVPVPVEENPKESKAEKKSWWQRVKNIVD